jgi:choline dehydrogenase
MGCRGWSFDDVLPYFKKLESTKLGSDSLRGRSGPVHIDEAKRLSPFYELFFRSAEAVGIPRNPDYNGADQEGVVMTQQTVRRGMRHSTATQYLKPARKRSNMTILSGAEAASLILEGDRCVGVRFRLGGVLKEARARREVILSCGTANSPKLLELSGIGNPEVLGRHGIETRHELRGVGENLRDHFATNLKWRLSKANIALTNHGRGWRLVREVLRFAIFGKGLISQPIAPVRAFTRSRPGLQGPDIVLDVGPYIVEARPGKNRRILPVEGFAVYAQPQRPESTGSIHISSADPFAPPRINYRFLETENDRQVAVGAVRRSREIAGAPPLRDVIAEELEPGLHIQSDQDILQFIRTNGIITHHMVGTCRMGQDPLAVVDERLRVHGLKGLRVADASIMPTLPSGNTSVPCMMIGEKCADMIMQDWAA